MVFRVQLTLMTNRGEQLHEDTITRLNVILTEIDVASIALQQMAQADADASQSLLHHSRELMANVIHKAVISETNLRHQAKQTGGFVMANAYSAVRAELDIMHASVLRWQIEMDLKTVLKCALLFAEVTNLDIEQRHFNVSSKCLGNRKRLPLKWRII